jgi:hypothetical protein
LRRLPIGIGNHRKMRLWMRGGVAAVYASDPACPEKANTEFAPVHR